MVRNYESNVEQLLDAYKVMGYKMPLKIRFLETDLDISQTNLGVVIKEGVRSCN
jgi:hypothetical protein